LGGKFGRGADGPFAPLPLKSVNLQQLSLVIWLNSTMRTEDEWSAGAGGRHVAGEYVETRDTARDKGRRGRRPRDVATTSLKSFHFRSAPEGTTPLVGARDRRAGR